MALRCENKELSLDVVLDIINNEKSSCVSRLNKPQGGDVFLFRNSTDKLQDWRADGYRWRQNGSTKIPFKSPVVRKVHFLLQTSNGNSKDFRKYAYSLIGDATYIVLHYLGNANIAEDFPHGNSKRQINFLGAAPSLKDKLAKSSVDYKTLVVESSIEDIQFQPRNSKQVTYYRTVSNQERRLGSDSVLTLHEMAYAIPDFVWSIRTFPDLVVCCGLPSLLQVVRDCDSVLLSYDTTFNVGDYYLSTLVVKLSIFVEEPSVPVAFVIHERKFTSVHAELCEHIDKLLNVKGDVVLVTDGEPAIVKAFSEKFPCWTTVSCWNHIQTDVEVWLKKHGGVADDVNIYKRNIHELLMCLTEGELTTKLITLEPTWSEAFHDYVNDKLMPRILCSYNGYLKKAGLRGDGITTNMSESMNMVIKQFNGWRERSPDLCVLSLYRLQQFYENEMKRSSSGFGPYTPTGRSNVVHFTALSTLALRDVLADIEAAMNGEHDTHVPLSVRAHAAKMPVIHIPELKVFSVAANDHITHSVHLFPKETCTCPATTTCCHIIAARHSIGLETNKRKILNLSALRRNSRKKADKKSGRKQPRLGDISYVAAPDSMAVNSHCESLDALEHDSGAIDDKCMNIAKESSQTDSTTNEQTLQQQNPPGVTVNVLSSEPKPDRRFRLSRRRVRFQCDTTPVSMDRDMLMTSTPVCKIMKSSPKKIFSVRRDISSIPATPVNDENKNVSSSDSAQPLSVELLNDISGQPNEDMDETWIGSLNLYQSDRLRLIDDQQPLNDRIINAAQQLLRGRSPRVSGLLDTVLVSAGRSCNVVNSESFTVQIVHDDCKQHWFTMTDKDCVADSVSVLCSLQQLPSTGAMQVLSKFLRMPGKQMTVNVLNTSQQKGPTSCGLFAIAYAESIVSGFDACNILYRESDMRSHLITCFEKGVISPFPTDGFRSVRRQIVRTRQYPVYCLCRSTYTSGEAMIQCNKCSIWFHPNCLAMHDSTFDRYCEPRKSYFCPDCVNEIRQTNTGCPSKSPPRLSSKDTCSIPKCNTSGGYGGDCHRKTESCSPDFDTHQHAVSADGLKLTFGPQQLQCPPSFSKHCDVVTRRKIDYVPYQSRGLKNLGNTCFLNSAVQLLKSVSDVRSVVSHHKSKHVSQSCVSCSLSHGFNGEPALLYHLMSDNCQYTEGVQQDVQEFITRLSQAMSVESEFDFELRQLMNKFNCTVTCTVECHKCGSVVNSNDTNDVMCINIHASCSNKTENVKSSTTSVTASQFHPATKVESSEVTESTPLRMEQLLQQMCVRSETIAYVCEDIRCTSTVAELTSQWIGFPEFLLVVVKRYDSKCQKISTEVNLDQVVRLKQGKISVSYSLKAVICHYGMTSQSGHYITLVKNEVNWLLFDDEKVSQTNNIDVPQFRRNAYVFAYTKDSGHVVPQDNIQHSPSLLKQNEGLTVVGDGDTDKEHHATENSSLMKNIEAVEHIQDLSLDQLSYLVKFHEHYLREIIRGNVHSERHEVYVEGDKKGRNALKRLLPVGVFTHEQSQFLMSLCSELFGESCFDYTLCVLLPEVMIKIVMHLRRLSHRAAESFIQSSFIDGMNN